jgi:hypothetical protein
VKREYTLEEWRAMRARTLPAVVRLAGQPRIRRRPRTDEERAALLRSTVAAAKRRERAGRLVRTGPRSYAHTIGRGTGQATRSLPTTTRGTGTR